MRVTQKEIASRLNLSQSLVAGVLNNRPNVWASEVTRQRILEAARELNYRPNPTARALRGGKTGMVAGVFLGPLTPPGVIEAMANELDAAGYELLVKFTPSQGHAAERLERLTSERAPDALLLWGPEPEVEETATQMASLGIPFVVKGRFEIDHPDWMQADFDHEGMMAQVVDHLAQSGNRRIAYLGRNDGWGSSQRLLEGYQAAMRRLWAADVPPFYTAQIGNGADAAAEALSRWLALPPHQQPTALVLGAGPEAWEGLERELARRGRRIGYERPDLAVVGLGGSSAPLWYGQGMSFPEADLVTLAEAMVRDLVVPILASQPPERPIIRLLPKLVSPASLGFPP